MNISAMMKMWNEAVDRRAAKFGPPRTIGNGHVLDYRWEDPDNFPHPTYKGGSNEAYAEWESVLKDAQDHGFDGMDVELKYGPHQFTTTFRKILKTSRFTGAPT